MRAAFTLHSNILGKWNEISTNGTVIWCKMKMGILIGIGVSKTWFQWESTSPDMAALYSHTKPGSNAAEYFSPWLYGYDYTSIPSSNVQTKVFNLSSLLLRRKRKDSLVINKTIIAKVRLRLDEFYRTSSSNPPDCSTKIRFPKARSWLRVWLSG